MNIYTKTGDKGETSLLGGERVKKHDARIETYGSIDELISYMGLIRDFSDEKTEKFIISIQNTLFNIGATITTANKKSKTKSVEVSYKDVEILEKKIDIINSKLPVLKNFIIPGGHPNVSHCHIARSVCRRAERRITALYEVEEINPVNIAYINRLSDYLFVLSRMFSSKLGIEEYNLYT